MASVQRHIEGRPFCIVTYHKDEDNILRQNMVDNMIVVCKNTCDDLELDYLEQYSNEDIHELTMYVQGREEGVQLIEILMQSHIYPNPPDEYRTFWASIFEECGSKWSRGRFREDGALATIFRVMYEWMEEDEWMEQEFAKYNGENYNEVVEYVHSAVVDIICAVGERWYQAQKYPETKKDYPLDILLVGGITNGLDEEQICYICRNLTTELLQERGIIS